MQKHFKLSGIIAILLCLSFILTGCTSGGKEPAASSNSNVVFGEDPLEFTFYGNYDWYVMPSWGEDAATAWIKENKKVNIVPISSGGSAVQKMSTMITGGTLPDVIWGERGADVERLRAAGKLVALDEPHGLMLDITGCAHLHGGERAMLERIVADFRRRGHRLASTSARSEPRRSSRSHRTT